MLHYLVFKLKNCVFKSPGGGIGRHARLRILCHLVCRFESYPGHFFMIYQETPQGIIVRFRIIPNANKNQIVGLANEEIKVRIAAHPEKGKANEELIAFLAKILHLAKSKIEIVQGASNRHKRLLISDISLNNLRKYLEGAF